mgnify:CR=1 FL=1
MRLNKSNVTLSPHTIFHDCLDESDRLSFLIAEVSNLTLKEQATLVLEAFTKMQDYMDIKKMSVEVLGDDE